MWQSVCGQKVTCFGEQAAQVVFIKSKLYGRLGYLKVNKKYPQMGAFTFPNKSVSSSFVPR